MIRCFKFGIVIEGTRINFIDVGRVVFVEKNDVTSVHMFNAQNGKQMARFGFSSRDSAFFKRFTGYLEANRIPFKKENTDKYDKMPVLPYEAATPPLSSVAGMFFGLRKRKK